MCEFKASRVPIQHYDQMKHLEIAQVSKILKIKKNYASNKINLTLKIKTNKRLNRKLFHLKCEINK